MSEYVLVGKVDRFGIPPDGHSYRFSTVLGESHHYACKRIEQLEQENTTLRQHLAAVIEASYSLMITVWHEETRQSQLRMLRPVHAAEAYLDSTKKEEAT